jgi:hypothetical protein
VHPAAEAVLTLGGIVLPSLALTAVMRRWFTPVPWRVAAGFLLLTLLFLGRSVVTPEVPVPVDEAAKGYPWAGILGPFESKNPLTNDTTRLFLPWMAVIREELSHGRLPLWNRYSFSGYPLLANGEAAPFYPPFLATLFVPLPKQIVAMAGLKVYAALLFTFILLRREGTGAGAAGFGAVAFALCSFQTVYLYYSTTAVTSLLPAAAFALLNALDHPSERRSLWLVASVVAVLQTAGHPESVLHVAIGTGAILLIDLLRSPHPRIPRDVARGLVTIAAGTAGGMMLSAPAWVPVLEQVFLSSRFAEVAGAARVMTPPFPGPAAWALLNPDLFGNPALGTWNWTLNYSIVASSFFGLLPLALFPAAMLSRRAVARDRLLGVAAVLSYLVAMNWSPVGRAINAVPPFSIVANDKLRFVTCLLVVICAARVVERMRERGSPVIAVSSAVVFGLAAYSVWTKLGVTVSIRAATALLSLPLFWAAVLAARRLRRPDVLPAVAAIAVALELLLLNLPFNAPVERRFFKPRLRIVEVLHGVGGPDPFRIVGHDWVLMPNASALYRLEDVRGSDPMELHSYRRYFELIGVDEPGMDVQRVVDLDHPALDFLNVTYALAEPGFRQSGPWNPVHEGPDGVLLQNLEALPRFFVPARATVRDGRPLIDQLRQLSRGDEVIVDRDIHASLLRRTPVATSANGAHQFTLVVASESPLFIASSQPAAPGWQVILDAKRLPLVIVNGAFLGFELPAGSQRITVRYRPLSFHASLGAAAVTLLLMIAAGAAIRRPLLTSGSGR